MDFRPKIQSNVFWGAFFMCTAISCNMGCSYFGRNLDLEYNYNESVTVTPRRYPFRWSDGKVSDSNYAMIGMAYVSEGYPLYYDAVNEKGVAVAGLSFPEYAVYSCSMEGRDNIASYELIPWLLARCADMNDVMYAVGRLNITDKAFSAELAPSPLHWMVSYKGESIVIEQTQSGLNVYNNSIGVLTNNPQFPYHIHSLNNYMSLSPANPKNNFGYRDLAVYSKGMGAIGLPGDNSSNSRFIRAAFTKCNSVWIDEEKGRVGQLFHILDAVAQVRGATRVDEAKYEITVYSACCNCDKGIYYYTTYENRQITAVDMNRENLDIHSLVSYPLCREEQIKVL